MNILCTSIPTVDFVKLLICRHGEGITLFVTELRPFEDAVSASLRELEKRNISIVLITDNMMGALFQNYEIDAVYSVFINKESENYLCPAGAHMAAILCEEYQKDFYLISLNSDNSLYLSDNNLKNFFGSSIATALENVNFVDYQWDRVEKSMVSEVLE